MSENILSEDTWTLIEPGLLQMDTTNLCIRYDAAWGLFRVEHNGAPLASHNYHTLETAKRKTYHYARDMFEMGLPI